MKNRPIIVLISVFLLISVINFEINQGFNINELSESFTDYTVSNSFELAESPIIQITKVEEDITFSEPNVVISSKYEVIGFNTFTESDHWIISLDANSSVTISDIKAEPTENDNLPVNFYLTLSNGTFLKFNKQGTILWSKQIFNGVSCSSTNCSRSITFLVNESPVIKNYKVILGGFDSNLFFLFQNGSQINSFQINNSISIIKSFESYTIIGTVTGMIHAFNNTNELVWSTNISSTSPVISLCITDDYVITDAWKEDSITLELSTGIPLTAFFELESEIITLDSIYVSRDTGSVLVSVLKGRLHKFDSQGKPDWIANFDSNVLTGVVTGNVTGSGMNEIITSSDIGTVAIINSTSGVILDELNVFNEIISSLYITDLNSDNIDDIIVGSITGSIAIIYGEDFIPPRFVTNLTYELSSENILDLFILTSELTTSILTLTPENGGQSIIFDNNTLRLNQSFTIKQLEEDKIYNIVITVYDDNGNSAKFSETLDKTNIIPKIPWDLYFGGLVGGLTCLAVLYFVVTSVLKMRYNRLADTALGLGDYARAIKLFYKAKNQEKIIDTVKNIMNNPELASKMHEIAQAAELEDYISEIHDLIVQEV